MKQCLFGALAIFVLGAAFLPACASKQQSAAPGGPPGAVVFKDGCRLVFPQDDPDQTWTWGTSKVNACEYFWQAEISVDGETYQMGYTNFNDGRSTSRSGPLNDLLRAGQANLWKLDPKSGGASFVDGALMGAWVKDDAIMCELHSQEWAERLFKDRPSSLKFITGGTLLQKTEREGSVEYRLEESVKGT